MNWPLLVVKESKNQLKVDSYWIVVDRDKVKPKQLNEIASQCKAEKINLEISTPCFSIWLALHFKEFDESSPSVFPCSTEKELCDGLSKWLCEQQVLCGGKHKEFHSEFSFFTLDQIRAAVDHGSRLYDSNPDAKLKGWADAGYYTGMHRIVERLI